MTVPQRVLDTMNSGLIYTCDDEEMIKAQKEQMELLYDFNAARPSQMTQRNEIARQLLGEFGEDAYIEPPLHANWGCNTYFSAHAYANFNLTLVDDGEVHIGEHTMIGPNCVLATANHPILPELREKAYQYNLPIRIGRNCWLGAGVIVVPGVTIGDNTVIGAGSVVTKDIPANVVAVGYPCHVLRPISEHDKEYFYRDRKINWETL